MAYRWGTLALVLWFGGLSCVAGCLAETRAIRAVAAAEQDSNGCADGCCSRDREESEDRQPARQHDSGVPHKGMDCCQFTMAPVNVTVKKAEELPVATATPQPVMTEAALWLPAVKDSSFVSDQSDTHLRCRVLRI